MQRYSVEMGSGPGDAVWAKLVKNADGLAVLHGDVLPLEKRERPPGMRALESAEVRKALMLLGYD